MNKQRNKKTNNILVKNNISLKSKGLLLLFLISITMNSYSQEFFTKELKWELSDSNTNLIFQDTTQIIEWGKGNMQFATIKSERLYIKNNDVLILMIDICSGIYCPSIYVFVESNKHWILKARTTARMVERIEIKVDNKLGKLIFYTKSSKIGELLLLPFFSCGQSNSELKLQNSFPIKQKEPICINEKNCFYFTSNSDVSYLKMYYLDEDKQKKLIDSVEFSPYKSRIHSFKSQKDNSYFILWETEYEYLPVIIAYYVSEDELVKIGQLEISLPCISCESFEYPIKDIQVFKKNEEIEISFLKNVRYKAKDTEQWKEYKSESLKFYFNILNKEFKVKTDN